MGASPIYPTWTAEEPTEPHSTPTTPALSGRWRFKASKQVATVVPLECATIVRVAFSEKYWTDLPADELPQLAERIE